MRLTRSYAVLVFASLYLASCASGDKAIAVTVTFEPGVKSTHVLVYAEGGGLQKQTQCMPIAGQRILDVAVVQADLPDTITLWAEGFSDDACATPTAPPENAVPIERKFRQGLILDGPLVLRQVRPSMETACDNGLDDDADGKLDCADADCAERTCTTGNACVAGQTCANGMCQGGQQVTCSTPPSSCFVAGGLCVVDAGCRYLPTPGADCSDDNECTVMDRCDVAGGCFGQVRTCATPPPGQCWAPEGVCVPDAGCTYQPDLGATCDDGQNCTVDDRCGGDAGCTGTAVVCEPRECMVPSGTCTADGGCLYAPRDAGLGCGDGGACNVQGACLPPFPFVPSNVAINDLPTPAPGKVIFDCGTTIIDTGASGEPSVTNACPGMPRFGSTSITQAGGLATVVLAFEDLEIAGGAKLSLIGVRPAIIVSLKNITVLGTIEVHAGAQACTTGGAGAAGGSNGFSYRSGGGGGGFGTPGGAGGPANPAPGGDGGVINLGAQLRGGCPGGPGGNNNARSAAGGGALQLIARQTLTLAGVITAPGAGGESGGLAGGGNGGGSGGDLLLEAQQFVASAGALACNGGGGGEGSTGNDGAPGSSTTTPAAGGSDGFFGGFGGNGAAGATAATNGDNASAVSHAGGGGGGAGRVRINVTNGCNIGPPVVISPPATSNRPDAGCP